MRTRWIVWIMLSGAVGGCGSTIGDLGGGCVKDNDCRGNEICLDGLCTALCNWDVDCHGADELCINGVCLAQAVETISCGSDVDCPETFGCNGQSRCVKADGFPCNGHVECESNHCVDGVCCATACSGVCQTCTNGTCGPLTSAGGPGCDDSCSYCDNGVCIPFDRGDVGECGPSEYCCGQPLDCAGSSATCPGQLGMLLDIPWTRFASITEPSASIYIY